MVKSLLKKIGLALIVLFLVQAIALAEDKPADSSFKSRCETAEKTDFPACASSPTECISTKKGTDAKPIYRVPFNCIFLQEPIGGKTGYDLFKATPIGAGKDSQMNYTLWFGEAIVRNEAGPFQAVLAFEAGKESQGPFGLLYNYLGLVYNFMSGIIIGFVVLVSIVGGIRMTVSGGNQTEFEGGRKMIMKALLGMVIWFTASVILYTINPTFFAF